MQPSDQGICMMPVTEGLISGIEPHGKIRSITKKTWASKTIGLEVHLCLQAKLIHWGENANWITQRLTPWEKFQWPKVSKYLWEQNGRLQTWLNTETAAWIVCFFFFFFFYNRLDIQCTRAHTRTQQSWISASQCLRGSVVLQAMAEENRVCGARSTMPYSTTTAIIFYCLLSPTPTPNPHHHLAPNQMTRISICHNKIAQNSYFCPHSQLIAL